MIVLPGGGQARVQSAVDSKAEQNFRGNAESQEEWRVGDLSTIVLTQLCNHTLIVFFCFRYVPILLSSLYLLFYFRTCTSMYL